MGAWARETTLANASAGDYASGGMIEFSCRVCRSGLQVDDELAGRMVRCPTCLGTTPVPGASDAAVPTATATKTTSTHRGRRQEDLRPPPPPATMGGVSTINRSAPGRRYGFNCAYCSSRLEATEAMAAQEGNCPTCGNTIVIPILDRYGRLIDPLTGKVIKQDPHPVHAYAAAGERAPRIVRNREGKHAIQCPRCGAINGITSNNCGPCGMPFTMEGTTAPIGGGASNGLAVASLVLGILSLPGSCLIVLGPLAVILGGVALYQLSQT
ncbi:MAG TPA: DUF4190 domain-containing protein, partial [Tepidisphaeraceae bacterium]|nr:DUF4190 domain-containing protein [Tepidisphaeraceae bacterium]